MEKCGRCGKPMDKPVGFLTFHDYSDYPVSAETMNIELCRSCAVEFKKWKNAS